MNQNIHHGRSFKDYIAQDRLVIIKYLSQPRSAMWFLVSGSRDFPNETLVRETMRAIVQPTDTLLHGGARGVDSWCAEEAQKCGATVFRRSAQWERYGRSAGMKRNTDMLNELVKIADFFHILLFWDGESRGTEHMLSMVSERQLPHTVIIPE
ncbi:MAG: hypothetical protein NPIRA02_02100 [Nitrospirales bacterium]|nr:MAG: hypothetical protein NPIRA02_02100 [Nitrospirales bacterium]